MTAAPDANSVEHWRRYLSHFVGNICGPWQRVHVLTETDSTQDAARRMDAQVGDVLVAWRQLSGRGRLGRVWADTGEDGVAATFVVDPARPERMAICCATAAAEAIKVIMRSIDGERPPRAELGIKWPNDIMADGRKIAGILIEQSGDRAYVGIGVNVRQTSWPQELRGRAISLAQLGVDVDRAKVIGALMLSLGCQWRESDERLVSRFHEMDMLTGTTCGFRIGEREFRGKVLRVDPMNGLAVLTESEGEVWLPAATTSVIKD